MKHAKVIDKNGTWWLYEKTNTDLPPRWFIIKTRAGRPLWETIRYYKFLQEAKAALETK